MSLELLAYVALIVGMYLALGFVSAAASDLCRAAYRKFPYWAVLWLGRAIGACLFGLHAFLGWFAVQVLR